MNEAIAVSTRVRLARNLKKYPFGNNLSDEERKQITEAVSASVKDSGFKIIDMANISEISAEHLAERHLISPEFASEKTKRAIALNSDESVVVMINEEDHIRIQSFCKGFDLKTAYEKAEETDNMIEAKNIYAFDEKLGYLTHCPTNLGTGLRASVMLHLPALEILGGIGKIVGTVGKLGICVRGIYGEGSQAKASLYQVSNQITLGMSDEEIISRVRDIALKIIEQEENARKILLKKDYYGIMDKISRAYGVLKNAYVLNISEFMEQISLVRLGVSLNLIKGDIKNIDSLIYKVQPAGIIEKYGEMNSIENDIRRAEIIRGELKSD